MEEMEDVVPMWVAGLLGGLSFVLLLVTIFVSWKANNRESPSESTRHEFHRGLLLHRFGGRFHLSVIVSLLLFACVAASFVSPMLYLLRHHAVRTSAYAKWGGRASINFCEGPDFSFSEYAAEPTNTLTSIIFYVGTSLFGLCGPGKAALRRQTRFYLCYITVLIIGIGSTALHATLLSSMQACDELPMLYILTMFGFCASDSFLGQNNCTLLRSLLPIGVLGVTVSATCVYFLKQEDFAVFGVIFAAYLAFTVTYLACYCLGLTSVAGKSKAEEEARRHIVLPLGQAVGGCFACGGIFWGLEMGFCSVALNGTLGSILSPFIWRYVLHTAWHALTAMAAHIGILMFIAIRGQELGWGKPALDWLGIPLISFHDKAF